MFILAKLLVDTGQLELAKEWYLRILDKVKNAFVYNEMANICLEMGRLTDSVMYRGKAVEVDPDDIAYWLEFAKGLIRIGKRNEGIELLRKRVQRATVNDSAAGSILLWQMHYGTEYTPEMFFEAYKKWGQRYVPVSMAKQSHDNDPDPDRRIRIGYISPDFRVHSASRSFEMLLDGHDRLQVDVYGYGNIDKPDKVTERFKEKFDYYRSVHEMIVWDGVLCWKDGGVPGVHPLRCQFLPLK